MKKIVLLMYVIFPVCVYSQFFQTGFQSEIPPTPTSSVFRQFAGYTPSLATGAVNVPIPLYELKAGNYTLPFSLQYYTSGIKVMAPAFPVGYGWSLNPGLRITRTIRGRPDGRSLFPMDIKSPDELENRMSEDESFYYLRSLMKSIYNDSDPMHITNADSQYDIFTIHLPSGNHTFILIDGKAFTCGNMLKIVPVKEQYNYFIYGFEVTDEYGVKYYFGDEHFTEAPSSYAEITTADTHFDFTAFMLRKITLPDDNLSEINFTWVKSTPYGGGCSGYPYEGGQSVLLREPYYNYPQEIKDRLDVMGASDIQPNTNDQYGYSLQLKQVDFPSGSIKLEYWNNNALTSFKVRNIFNETIKQIDFAYKEETVGLPYTLLSSINFSDEGKYKFTYNPERFTVGPSGQDHWGYYNGRNESLVPQISIRINGEWILANGGNRSIDRDKMQANILTRVDYPTGGYTELEYEPHRFEEPASRYNTISSQLTEGRGLRVSKVITKADAGSSPVTKTYMYGKNNGKGIINIPMSTLDSFWEINRYVDAIFTGNMGHLVYSYDLMSVSSISQFDRVFSMTPSVYYDYITEYVSAGDGTKLKTEYTYSLPEFDNYRYTEKNHYYVYVQRNLFSKGPLLKGKKTYKTSSDNTYVPVENITYRYSPHLEDRISELYVTRSKMDAYSENGRKPWPDFRDPMGLIRLLFFIRGYGDVFPPFYDYVETWIEPYWSSPAGETRTVYTDSGEVCTDTEDTYKDNTLLLKKEVTGSNGTKVTEEYQYRTYNGRTYAYPTLAKKTVNGLSESKRTDYYYNKTGQVESISLYKDHPDYFSGLDRRVTYHNYNNYGKPVYITLDDATKIVYLWSYKGQYPVAEIKDATLDEVNAVMGSVFGVATTDALSVLSKPNETKLKNGSLQKALPNAIVTTYTYKPLVGMLTATGPTGISTYYEYDSFGRLKYIRDNDQNILNRYAYNYHDGSVKDIEKDTVYHESKLFLENFYIDPRINMSSPAPFTFKANKRGGSGSYNYKWTIKEKKTGETIASHNSGKNGEYNVDMRSLGSGEKQLICSLTDNITGEIREESGTFNVYITPLMFEDIKGQPPIDQVKTCIMSADIYSYSAQNVQFYLWSYGVGGSDVQCTIIKGNGQRVEFDWPPPSQNINSYDEIEKSKKTVSLAAGLNRIEVRFLSGSSNQVKFYLNTIYPELDSRIVGGRHLWYGTVMTYPWMY